MPDPSPTPPNAPITLNDVYYVLFRHKWMILGFFAAAILAAGTLFLLLPKRYVSEAKLLVRYVQDTRNIAPGEKDPQVRTPDSRGETIINSEVEILTSLDLAEEVAEVLGPLKILAKTGITTNGLTSDMLRHAAAAVIANPKNLLVENPKNSSIIRVQFQHPDGAMVEPVLTNLISSYVQKHLAIHRGVGVMDDFLSKQIDELRSSLNTTEAELWNLKTNAGIISVEDSKKAFNDEIMKIQADLLAAEAELAERSAGAKELGKTQPATTNAVAELETPADQIDEYKRVCERLNAFRRSESTNTLRFRDENPIVKGIRAQIAEAETQKKQMETNFPKLATLNIPIASPNSQPSEARGQFLDPLSEYARAKALEAKIKVLAEQLVKMRAGASAVDLAGTRILATQRKKDLDEASYRYYLSLREQAKADQALGPGRVTNISVVQAPSPPGIARTKNDKIVLGALAGLIALGLAIAFGLELFLDPRVKRPSEIESKLHLPLFLSIPFAPSTPTLDLNPALQTKPGRFHRLLSIFGKTRLPALNLNPNPGRMTADKPGQEHQSSAIGDRPSPEGTPQPLVAPKPGIGGSILNSQLSTANSQLNPYYAAIRDRLTMYFQSRNLLHKPKLVGVTSSGKGAGVTTLAAGLAASFSELGGGNVLLIDMGVPNGIVHPFLNGKKITTLREALVAQPALAGQSVPADDTGTSAGSDFASAKPVDSGAGLPPASHPSNLVLAKANESGEKSFSLVPAKLSALMPRLQASDYDYIIFDMPPVSSTSPTASLASMLDMTFLVLEAEKSNRDTAKRSISSLAASRANVAAILNKTRNYLPAWLHQDF